MAKAENPKAIEGDNSRTTSVASDQVRAFLERLERLDEEKAAIAEDIKEVYAEAKGNGYDTKILKKLLAIKKQGAKEYQEEQAMIDLYGKAGGVFA